MLSDAERAVSDAHLKSLARALRDRLEEHGLLDPADADDFNDAATYILGGLRAAVKGVELGNEIEIAMVEAMNGAGCDAPDRALGKSADETGASR